MQPTKRWRVDRQRYFLERTAELLEEGFPLRDALQFLALMMAKERPDIDAMEEMLETGVSFPETLKTVGFPDQIVAQIYLSLQHSRLVPTLRSCAQHLHSKEEQLAKLQKTLLYPLFLLTFTTGTLLFIRTLLLPQLETSLDGSDAGLVVEGLILFLKFLPQLLLAACLLPLAGGGLYAGQLRGKAALERAISQSRVPILGKWLVSYHTFFFSREFAYFFHAGHSLLEILDTFQEEPATPLMRELAASFREGMLAGEDFSSLVQKSPLFRKEMAWLIYQGELTGHLGVKLELYSKECYASLLQDIERKINLLQPLLFLLIGIIILLVYGALMLPTLTILKGVL